MSCRLLKKWKIQLSSSVRHASARLIYSEVRNRSRFELCSSIIQKKKKNTTLRKLMWHSAEVKEETSFILL